MASKAPTKKVLMQTIVKERSDWGEWGSGRLDEYDGEKRETEARSCTNVRSSRDAMGSNGIRVGVEAKRSTVLLGQSTLHAPVF